MKESNQFALILIAAMLAGSIIGWNDSRPGWDDTGVTVGLVLGVSGFFGFVFPKHFWIWALAIGGGVPLFNIVLTNNFGSAVALVIAFAGASIGSLVAKKQE